jgi:localization factor PodJL
MRLVAVHTPMLQKSDVTGHPTKTADVDASYGKAGDAVVARPSAALQADKTPIASIAPVSKPVEASPESVDRKLSASMSPALPAALRDAVAAGTPAAQYEVAQRLLEGRGVPQDEQAAALWFERAASAGLAPAQFRLGTLYSKGLGVQRDAAAATRWYAKAAEAGNARAAHNLAVLYAEPAGETPDYVEAAKWFRKAAELGIRDSQYNLAILYARGLGVEQDFAQSWMWLSLAATQGDEAAAKKRGEVAAKMSPNQLAVAAEDLANFKTVKPDPAANEAPAPAAGWEGKGSSPPTGASASTTP